MSAAEFGRFLAQLVPMPEARADTTNGGRALRNVERAREAIATAYRTTPDLANITGDQWGALQAVTAYVDHVQRAGAEAEGGRVVVSVAFEPRAGTNERVVG